MKVLNKSDIALVSGGNLITLGGALTTLSAVALPGIFEGVGYMAGLGMSSYMGYSTAGTLALSSIGATIAPPIAVLAGVTTMALGITLDRIFK